LNGREGTLLFVKRGVTREKGKKREFTKGEEKGRKMPLSMLKGAVFILQGKAEQEGGK